MTTPLALPLPNNADLRLLELYPRWFAAMTAWDAAEDVAGAYPYNARPVDLQATCDATCETLGAFEKEADAITGHGVVGAVVKLCMYRAQARSRGDEIDVEAFRAIAILGAALALPLYEHGVHEEQEAA